VRIDDEDVFDRNPAELSDFRNRSIGFVFQSHYLLPEFTALQNVAMPALVQRRSNGESEELARRALVQVGLGDRLAHKPGELSGGEQQRVALARALVLKPRLLLADEPTGNLDPETGEGIHRLLIEMNEQLGITAVVVTHNHGLAERMPRCLRLQDGLLVPWPRRPRPDSAAS
jgi:lipoprotein-releasing system ATP-binding protein